MFKENISEVVTSLRHQTTLLIVYFFNGIRAGSVLCTTYILLAALGINEYGVYVTALAMVTLLISVLEVRNTEAVAVLHSGGMLLRRLWAIGIVLDFCLAVLFLILSLVIYSILAVIGSHPNQGLSILTISCLIGYGLSVLLRQSSTGVLVAKRRFVVAAAISLAEEVIKLSIISFNTLLGAQLTLEMIAMAWATAGFGALIFSVFAAMWFCDSSGDLEATGDSECLSNYKRFISASFMGTFFKSAHSRTDVFIVGTFIAPNVAALVDLGKKIYQPLTFIISPLGHISLKKMSDAAKSGAAQLRRLVILYLSTTLIFSAFYSAVILWWILEFQLEIIKAAGLRETTLLLFIFGQMVSASMWWCRNYSNMTKQRYSVMGNILGAVYVLSIVPAAVYFLNAGGVISLMAILQVVLLVYWLSVLRKNKSINKHVFMGGASA